MEANPFQPANVLARAQQGLATFEAGRSYTKVRCVVRQAEAKKGGRNGEYLNVTLADRTGEKEAKCWDGASLAPSLHPGAVVEIDRLDVDGYGPKFDPKALHILPVGSYDPREFVPSLPIELIEANWRDLQARLDGLENPDLLRLRDAVFGRADLAEAYKRHPSGIYHHHNYIGGNVHHVLGLVRVVDAVSASYPELDREVALIGATLHDLGKLREYAVDTMIRVTEEGRLRGHLVIGAEWLAQICAQLRHDGYDFPRGLENHLVHIILSHHRKGEWGSPKPPATPEAMLVHLADYADSQTKGFLQFVEEHRAEPDGWARRWDSDSGQKEWVKTRLDWE